jgi:hypothetical protein
MKVEFDKEQLKFLSEANKVQRKAIRGRMLAPYIEQIEQEANEKFPDKPNQEAEQTTQNLEARKKYIKEETDELKKDLNKQIRNLSGTGTRAVLEGGVKQIRSVIQPLLDMNIVVDGVLVDYNDLVKIKLRDRRNIEIRNKDISLLENESLQAAVAGASQNDDLKILADNYDFIIEKLSEDMEEKEAEISIVERKFPVKRYLGVADASKKSTRIEIYDFWNSTTKKFEQFKEDTEKLFEKLEKLQFPEEADEAQDALEDLQKIDLNKLQYVAYFPSVDRDFTNRRQKFWNIIFNIMIAEDLFDKESLEERYEDDPVSFADINSELTADLMSSLSQDAGGGQTLSGESLGQYTDENTTEFSGDVSKLRAVADPLLIYEDNTNNKLVSITEEAELELLDALQDIQESLSNREGLEGQEIISLNTQYDLQRWADEMEDTTVLDEDYKAKFALPISVMTNSNFAESYPKGESFEALNGEKISLDNLDMIKDFFEDLYRLLTADQFRAEVQIRSSTGLRGSMMDSRDKKRLGVAPKTEFPVPLQRGGELREVMEEVSDALKKMMKSAVEYFFNPIYAGYLPISVPTFGRSLGTQVFQLLSVDLGVETVLSSSIEMAFEGSLNEASNDDLRSIADFLENMFDSGVTIGADLIDEGVEAADGLTRIFGKEEENDNYCAAIIYHFAKDAFDEEKLEKFGKRKFARKTIKERYDAFYEQHNKKQGFPIFALPTWLDRNQGALTQDSTKRKQYNRLKDLFENVQIDLPVLLHKMLKAHDIIRKQLGKEVVHGRRILNTHGINKVINKMQVEQQIDLSVYEVEKIVTGDDSHNNIAKEYGISADQVYLIKAEFR